MVAWTLVVSLILLFVVSVYVIARIVAHRINQWAEAMVCSFGVPPLQEEIQEEEPEEEEAVNAGSATKWPKSLQYNGLMRGESIESYHNLTTATISAVFADSVVDHSGRVTEIHDAGTRLFLRALLPFQEEVRPGDRMQAGLALRASESEISLHPYLFRQICRNGAIMAHSIQSCHVEYSQYASEEDVIWLLWDAIGACCEREVFTANVGDVRTSVHVEADSALNHTLNQLHWQSVLPKTILDVIFKRFSSSRNKSRFSLMNAITSVARDTRDQEQRWRLEELGGGIGAGISPKQPFAGGGVHKPLHETTVFSQSNQLDRTRVPAPS